MMYRYKFILLDHDESKETKKGAINGPFFIPRVRRAYS